MFTGAELIVAFGIFFLEGHLFHQRPDEKRRVERLFERLEGDRETLPRRTTRRPPRRKAAVRPLRRRGPSQQPTRRRARRLH
jgi:hypothetical protein